MGNRRKPGTPVMVQITVQALNLVNENNQINFIKLVVNNRHKSQSQIYSCVY
jgi:hypothetical protein